MNTKKILKKTMGIISAMIVGSNLLITKVKAQAFTDPTGFGENKKVGEIAGDFIQKILGWVGVVALILFIYAGFVWLMAQGDSKKIKKSQDIMKWAGIGLILIFGAYTILKFVFQII